MSAEDAQVEKFNKIWRSLHRALSMPVFGPCEQSILQVAQELSFTSAVLDGSGKARAFVIYPARLAAARGFTREAVSRAITRLMEGNVLTGDRGCLRLNKRYKTWRPPYSLSEAQTAECLAADVQPVTRCGSPIIVRDQKKRDRRITDTVIGGSQGDPDRDPAITENVTFGSRCTNERDPKVTETVIRKSRNRDPEVTLHIERARGEESKERENTLSCNTSGEFNEARERQEEFFPEPFIPPVASEPPPPAADDPGMKYVRDALLNGTRGKDYPGGRADIAEFAVTEFVSWRSQGYPEAIVRDAFLKAIRKGAVKAPRNLAAYVKAVLVSWAAEQTDRPAAPPRPAARPIEFHVAPPRPKFPPREPRS